MKVDNTSPQWAAAIIVLATGVVVGLFVWKTYFASVLHLYPLEFTQGQWIVAPEAGPQGYFRKELYLPGPVRQAWIMVAAPDTFVLYLNGKPIGRQNQAMRNTAGIYDITSHLHPGKNVIGVQAVRLTYPGPARAVIEGAYLDQIAREHRFFSDTSWKAASYEVSQDDGNLLWHTEAFRADAWLSALAGGTPAVAEVSRVDVPATLLISPSQGIWIGHAAPTARTVIFAGTCEIAQKVDGAWVRIAAEERYDLAVNGVGVARRNTIERTLDIYDVSPFLKQGTNTVQVTVTGQSQPRVMLDGSIVIAGQTRTVLTTDGTWKTRQPAAVQWESATVLTTAAWASDGLVKTLRHASLPVTHQGKQRIRLLICLLVVLLVTVLTWMGSAVLLQRQQPGMAQRTARTMDALLHLPSLLFLGFVYLLQYDIDYDPALPFQGKFLSLAIALLVVLRGGLLLEICFGKRLSGLTAARSLVAQGLSMAQRYRTLCCVGCIVPIALVGFLLRVADLQTASLSHDEVGVARNAKSILVHGYPFKTVGPIEKTLTTYELLPYPVALSIGLFGSNDFAVRLPAAVFGTLAICVIFYIGMQLWGVWTGILAATIYACLPFSILWGSNAFHPQQTQLLTLLTSYVFYKAIDTDPKTIQTPYIYGSAVGFILTYLSWEGSGVLLLAFFSYLLVARGKDMSWLKCKHLWLAVAIVGLAVFGQQSRRILTNVPYIVVGQGLSGATFKLFFLDPHYNPLFYVQTFLLAGNHIVLIALVIFGLPLIFTNRGLRYYFIIMAMLLMLLTNFLPNIALRYAYFFQPFLILQASAVAVHFVAFLWNTLKESAFWMVVTVKSLFAVAFLTTVFLLTTSQVLQLYRLGSMWNSQTLPEFYGIDYRSTHHFIKTHTAPDDIVISLMPGTLEHYSNRRIDYYVQSYANRQIFYDVSEETGSYLDKSMGKPVVRDLAELKDVLHRYRRVWIVAAPYGTFLSSNDAQIIEHISKHSKVMYESYKTRVYLWNK